MKLVVAETLNEYKTIVQKQKSVGNTLWFRGMKNSSYSLIPSLFREKRIVGLEFSGRPINGHYYRKSDAIMKSDLAAIDKFIGFYKGHYPKKCLNYNLIDYLYIMQHYDIPTRLLDFSTDECVALYFSVASADLRASSDPKHEISEFYKNEGFTDQGSSVHIINPGSTNGNTSQFVNIKDEVLNIDDIDIDVLSRIILPICVKTDNDDPRIVGQKGVFMLFGSDYRAYDEYEVFQPETVKIFIPNSCRLKIKDELRESGIFHSSIYPDMKGISLEIIDQIEHNYHVSCRRVFGSSY